MTTPATPTPAHKISTTTPLADLQALNQEAAQLNDAVANAKRRAATLADSIANGEGKLSAEQVQAQFGTTLPAVQQLIDKVNEL